MKKIIISAACLAIALASCNQIETPENEYQAMSLGINVTTAAETKGLVRGTKLPDGSSVGIFVTDKSGVTYDGQTFTNVKYTASGSESSQTWSSETSIMLSSNQAVLASYYPYSEDVTDVKAIPVKATSDIQTDWMWAQPITGLNSKNTTANITMNHALAAVRLSVLQGSGEGSVEVTSVGFSSDGAATEALLDATKGTFSSISGQGTQFVAYETFTTSNTAEKFEFMTIPTGVSAPVVVELTVNGSKMTALGKSVRLEAGYIYDYTISVDGTNGASINAVGMRDWKEGNQQGGVAFYEELEYDFDGTIPDPFVEWAAIQHKDGSLYSVSKWNAYETAGLVTDADANGVVVLYSKNAVCPQVIHPKQSGTSLKWSNTETIVPGVAIANTTYDANLDLNGKANTEAILAAVTNGTLADAPAAQYCAGVTFANGQQGYLPAAGELQAWHDNKNAINSCMQAIGATILEKETFSSTQSYESYYAYKFIFNYSEIYSSRKTQTGYARPVIKFETEFTPPTEDNPSVPAPIPIPAAGVKILAYDGSMYTKTEWDNSKIAAGVVVSDGEHAFVIHPRAEYLGSVKWSNTTVNITDGITTTTTKSTAQTDFAGEANTAAILAVIGKDAPTTSAPAAAQYCASIGFAHGKTGYLPSAGELTLAYTYTSEISACLAAINGSKAFNLNYSWWTSTQYNSSSTAWYLSNGDLSSYSKSFTANVRAFSAL